MTMVSGRSGLRVRRWSVLVVVGGVLLSLLAVTPVSAADPGDESATAIPIAAIGEPQDYDTASATSETSDPDLCDTQTGDLFEGPFSHTFWHTFTPSDSGELIVDVNSFPDPEEVGFLAVLFVFADDGTGGLDLVECSAFPATIELSAEAGTTYYAMTGSLPETDRGGPAVITVLQPFVSDLTVDGRAAYDPQTNEVTISGTVDCLTPAEFFMSASARQTIGKHQVFGFGETFGSQPCDGVTSWTLTLSGETGPFNPGALDFSVDIQACAALCVGDFVEATVKARPTSNKPGPPPPPPPPAPDNDALADAIALEVGGPTLETDTAGATVDLATDPQECPFAGFPPSEHTVWYTVTPAIDGWVEVNTEGSDYDTTLYVLDGDAVIACNDDTFGVQSQVKFEVTAGTSYAVMSGTFADSPGGHLVITAAPTDAPPPPPNNDERDGAFPIALGESLDQDTAGATSNGSDPTECPDQFGVGSSDTVWYEFTATDDGFVEVNTFGSDYPTYLFILDGDEIAACNGQAPESDQSQAVFEATSGVTYSITIGSFVGTSGMLTLTVIAGEEPPPPPEPIELEVTLDPTGSVNTKTGVATVHGTVSCSREASGEVSAFAFQEGGRFDAQGGGFSEIATCGPEATTWSVELTSETTKFLAGDADVGGEVFVFTEDGASTGTFVEGTVRLRPDKTAQSPSSTDALVVSSPPAEGAPVERVPGHGKPAPVDETPTIVAPDAASESKVRGPDRAPAKVHERGAKAPTDVTEGTTVQRNALRLK
jgi:hypothetical protein